MNNAERNAAMYRLRGEGLTLAQIGARFGMTRQAVEQNLRVHTRKTGDPEHPTVFNRQGQEAFTLRAQGLSWGEVGRRLGVSWICALQRGRRYAESHGLTLPQVRAPMPHATPDKNRSAYEMRERGMPWRTIGEALEYNPYPMQRACNAARTHAQQHGLTWPITPKETP